MEKLLTMNIAATLAAAVVSNLPDSLEIDADIQDPNLRAENLMTWELFRIFYHAAKGAAENDKDWPPPQRSDDDLIGRVQGLLARPELNAIVEALLKRLADDVIKPEPKVEPLPDPKA